MRKRPVFGLSRYGGDAWGVGVWCAWPRYTQHRWLFALMHGGSLALWRFYWHGLGSWYIGWRRRQSKECLIVDVGPFAVRVHG
jgi:hypothetical protein